MAHARLRPEPEPPSYVIDVPCWFCGALREEPCETTAGKRCPRVHVVRTRLYCQKIGRRSPR